MIALYLVPRRFDVASTVRVEVTTDMQILCNWHKGKYCLISVSHDEVISDLSYLHFKVEGMDICCSKSLLAYVHLADYFWKKYMSSPRPTNTCLIPFCTPEGHGTLPEKIDFHYRHKII